MTRRFRLQTILDLAEREADKSAARLGHLHAQKHQLEAKLNLLLQYREDYLARFRTDMRVNPRGAGWDNFHDFMDKLDTAITQQRAMVAHAHDLVLTGQAEHRDRQRRVQAFDTLAARHHSAEHQRAAQADQRSADEIAATTVRRRSGGS